MRGKRLSVHIKNNMRKRKRQGTKDQNSLTQKETVRGKRKKLTSASGEVLVCEVKH